MNFLANMLKRQLQQKQDLLGLYSLVPLDRLFLWLAHSFHFFKQYKVSCLVKAGTQLSLARATSSSDLVKAYLVAVGCEVGITL